jgi:hypothetical protein
MSVPTPPLISVRPRVTPTTLEFWWAPPASPNGTITGYTLSCISPSITETYSGTTGYAELTGLTNGTDYAFTLVATNATGNSAPAAFRTVRTSAKPAAVATLTKTQTVTNSVLSCTFSWTNPGGDYAYYYVIGIHAAAGTKDYIYRGTRDYATLSYTIGGLDPTQSYTFHAQRGNDAGYSIRTNITTAKSATFDPRTVTGLQAWYDAADTAGDGSTVADGTSIATWVDKSGNSRNAAAAGGSSTLQTDSAGRRLNLNGTTNRYNLPSGSWSQGQPFTVFSADSSTTEVGSTLVGSANTGASKDGFSVGYEQAKDILLIASSNGIAYSLDGGNNWTKSPSAAAIFLSGANKIAWNGSIYVAVGASYIPGTPSSTYSTVGYSYDGINWLQSYSGRNPWGTASGSAISIATNASLWLATGSATTSIYIQRSNDGINWATDISGSAIFSSGTLIEYNPNTSMWVASDGGKMYYSYNASTWTTSPSGFIFRGAASNIVYHGTTWLAITVSGPPAYSFDGITWAVGSSLVQIAGYVNSGALATNGSIWLVAGGGGYNAIQYSFDAINWQNAQTSIDIFRAQDGYGMNVPQSFSWNGEYWLATNTYNNNMVKSYDGVNWVAVLGPIPYAGIGTSAIMSYAPVNNYSLVANTRKRMWLAGVSSGGTGYTLLYSYDGLTWYASLSTTNGNGLSQLFNTCYAFATNGNGLWVLGGYSYSLAYSYDGFLWNISSSGSALFGTCYAVAYNGSNLWVAAGTSATNRLAYSSDGINWTASTSGNALLTGTCYSVAWNGSNRWVAGGNSGAGNFIIYSSDGITWTNSTSGSALFTGACYSVVWNGSIWVAGGNGTNQLAYSSNGIDWTASASGNSVFTTNCNSVGWNGSIWVAGGQGTNQLAYSYDGINWTASVSGNAVFTSSCTSVAWGDSLWVASGSGTNITAYSYDGINWSANQGFNATLAQYGKGVVYGIATDYSTVSLKGTVPYTVKAKTTVPAAQTTYTTVTKNIWLAGNTALSYSYDGINWTGSGSGNYIANVLNGTGTFSALATNGTNLWVGGISGGTNRLAYSSDGINWSGSTSGNALFTTDCRAVAYNGSNKWVAGGSGTNQLAYSSNGIAWTASTSGNTLFTTDCRAVAYNGSNKWVAGGSGTNQLAYSSDGETWTASTSGNGIFTTDCRAVAYNGTNKWVAGGSGTNQLAYSSDGETWTASTSGNAIFTTDCRAVAYNGTNKWVAGGTGTNQLAYSSDGETWTASASGNAILTTGCYSVAWAGSRWVAGGAGTQKMAYSSDGETWTAIAGSGLCYSIANGPSIQKVPVFTPTGQRWIAGTTSGSTQLAYSDDGITWNFMYGPANSAGWGPTSWNAIAKNDSMWIGIGDDGIKQSQDGINWFYIGFQFGAPVGGSAIVWNGSIWVAGGQAPVYNSPSVPYFAYSYDGFSWFESTSGTALFSSTCKTMAWNGTNKFVAGGIGTNKLGYSSNGITWTASTSGNEIFTTSCLFVAWNGSNKWVAGGAGTNQLAYSSDGETWSASTSGNEIFTTDCKAVAYNGTNKWVAGGSGTNQIAYSSDGETWTASASGNALFTTSCQAVAWSNSKWVASGLSGATPVVAYSSDGIDWTASTTGNSLFSGAAPTCFAYGFYHTAETPNTYTSPSQIKNKTVSVTSVSVDATRTVTQNNQILTADGTSTPLIDATLSIGAIKGTSSFYTGGMREVLIYTGTLADADKAAVTDYLVSKWAAPALTLVPVPPVKHGMAQWLDATDATTLFQDAAGITPVTSNNNPVGLWRDKSGAGNDLTGVDSLRAVYKTSSINTRAGIDCSGALLSSSPYQTASESTILIVVRSTVNTSGTPYGIWSHQSTTIGGNYPNTYFSGFPLDTGSIQSRYVLARPSVYVGTITKGQLITLQGYDLSGTTSFSTVGAPMTNSIMAQIQLGLRSTVTGVISVGEVIYYQRVLTATEISTMVSYLQTKWGITPPAAMNLTDNLQVWLDAADPYTVFTSGSEVTAWKDRTGRGNDATPVASPTYSGNGVVFNGTSQYFDLPNGALPSGNSPYSYYAVTKFTDLSGYGIMGGGANTNNYGRLSIEAFKSRFIVAGSPNGGLAYSYDDGITWAISVPIPSTLLPAASYPIAIGYNGTVWVCGAQPTITLYSYDGVVWNNAQNNPFTNFNAVTWNGSMWIGAGYSPSFACIAFSYDGISWYPSASGNALFTGSGWAIAANGSGFTVAGGQTYVANTVIAYSSDGFTWTSSASGSALFTTYVAAIATDGTKWVAVGAGTNQLAYSSNGQTWTASTSGNDLITNTCHAVATNGTTWVAGGFGTNIIIYSSDGETWTASASANALLTGGKCRTVAWNGSVWVAGAEDAAYAIIYSTDGITWTGSASSTTTLVKCYSAASMRVLPSATPQYRTSTQTTIGPPPSGPDRALQGALQLHLQTTVTSTSVTPSVPGSKFLVAGGSGANTVAYSNDNGATWTASASGSALFTTAGWRSAYNGTKWVMGGEGDNRLAYSSDGIAWTASASGNTKFTTAVYGVAWNGSNLWVAVGSGTNKLAYSSNGETWTESASGNTQMSTQGNAVASNGTMWVAGGQNATNPVAYSRDGMNWYGAPTSSFLGAGCVSVAWNGSVWVAGSTDSAKVAYSYDGIVWMAAFTPFTSSVNFLSFNGSIWVAAGNGTNQLAYSSDGINWTVSTSGNASITSNCRTVAWTGDTWFAGGIGTNQIAYSSDGINWTASTTGSAMFTGGECGGIATNMVLPIQRITATSSSPSSFLVESLYASGNPMTQYMNASLDATDSTAITHAQLTTNNTVGKTPSGKYMKGSIYEIMVYNVAHTALQRQQVEAYLLGKWVQPAYTPALASFAPTLWLESADTTNLTMSGSDILVWKDKSGRGVNLTPTVASCFPQYAYDPVTMKYGVLFGSKGYTTGLTNTLLNIYAPTTVSSSIFFVARFNNTNLVNTIYTTPVAGQTNVPYFRITNGNISRVMGTSGTSQFASMSNPTQPFIGNLNIVNTGSGYPQADLRINTIVINGEANGSAGNLSGASKIVLGSNNTASPIMTNSEGLNGYIFEYVVFPYCLDAASGIQFARPETRKVEGYLAWKWGLEGSLPSSHPYKYRAP